MNNSGNFFELKGALQHYSWGGSHFINALLGIPQHGGQPVAEYWMGAHAAAPSSIMADGKTERLDEWISKEPRRILGEKVYQAFGQLPYLFKVLDVKDMLSIQVHPTREAAGICYREENSKGIPLNAPERNYKDTNHKPELMLALSPFWLLHGFREPASLRSILESVPEFRYLIPVWEAQGYRGLYQTVMLQSRGEVNERLRSLVDRIEGLYHAGALSKETPDFWAARAYHTFCTGGDLDRGLYAVYFLNLVHLKAGQAIFQDAGILHAYLEGQNLELMANSDNVLRGGLTHKHIDTSELLRHVLFVPTHPNILEPEVDAASGERRFPTPAPDFELRSIELTNGDTCSLHSETAEIYLVLDGLVEVKDDFKQLTLHKGASFLSIHGTDLLLKGITSSTLYKATVPLIPVD